MNKRLHGISLFARHPLFILGTLWPLALITPFMPGLPRPNISGLPWRQELTIALLVCATLALLAKQSKKFTAPKLKIQRLDLCLLIPLALFVLWSAASVLWSGAAYAAIHHTLEWSIYLLFFLLMRRIAARPRLLRASILSLGASVFIISVSCIVGSWGAPDSLFRQNGLGEPLAIAIPLFTTLALTLRRRRAALFCGAAALIAWLAVIQMLERAPFIATSVALIVIAVSSALVPQYRSRSLLRAVLLGASFFIVFAFETNLISLKQETTQAASRTVVARLQTTGVNDDSTNVRFLFWAVGWQMWRAHPLAGVGANNYDVAFPESRKAFAEKHPNSPLIDLNADLIAQRAHNEYVQILAELGLIGFALFAAFCVALMYCAAKAVCYARNPLALGATGSLIVFALSSGASSVSFRWAGSGLMFFFAAAIVARMASLSAPQTASTVKLAPPLLKATNFAALALALLVFAGMSAQALNITLHGAAQASSDSQETERRYRAALFWNPFDAATHYNFGLLLYFNNRAKEAVPHLRYAAQRGFNSSICYEYLAGAEIGAGDAASAEQTLAYAVKVYPRSVFLRARYGAMLAALNKPTEAASEYAVAESINLRLARGWQQLINYGVDAATQAANRDTNISRPGELLPEEGVFAVLAEDNQRCCLSANFLHQQSIAVSR